MTLLKPTRTRLHDDMVRAEHALELASATAMRWFLARITDEALNSQTALVAAAAPRNGLTLGEAEGWWTRTVDDRMLDPIQVIWQAGWSAHSTGKILSTSNDEFATFMARVRDRLVRGLKPGLPEDAFNTIRHVITTGGALGWSTQQTAQRIAKELAWEKNAGYWRRELALAEKQIDRLLDPLGVPGTSAREHARLNDPRVKVLQSDRSRAVLALERDASHWAQRATLIARSESTAAYNHGAWNALTVEGVTCKTWLATSDARTRPSHARADGQTVKMRRPFIVGGYEMQHPGAPSAPPEEVCNCVVGSTQVEWPGQDVHAVTRRRYYGEFIELVTARGHQLTCTPNHPILAAFGYVAAHTLRPGDHVLCTLLPPLPEVDDGPSSIEQVQAAALETRLPRRVRLTAVDFHGDGTDTEVEIVGTYGDLPLELNTPSGGNVSELVFPLSDDRQPPLPGHGTTSARPLTPSGRLGQVKLLLVTASIVRRCRELTTLFRGHSLHPQDVGLTARADGQPEFIETQTDDVSADSDFTRHTKNALALGMTPCEVISVNRYSGNHDVFNLSTADGWYIGNGIAQHNCRCAMVGAEC